MQELEMVLSELCHHLNCHLNCCHRQELFVLMALTALALALALALVMPPFPSTHVPFDQTLNL
jgi:hypothetical protein